jgi:exo-beta-1,3-glucanase (GH17 family)
MQLIPGNESVFQGHLSASELVSFIQSATQKLRAAGYTGIISTAETVGVYQQHPSICDVIDNVHANVHPFYDPNTCSSEAGTFVVSQRKSVADLCGKPVVVSETGWPSSGGSNYNAVASPSDQEIAVSAIHDATGGDVIFFSYSDDAWKAPGPEQHFGMSFSMEII